MRQRSAPIRTMGCGLGGISRGNYGEWGEIYTDSGANRPIRPERRPSLLGAELRIEVPRSDEAGEGGRALGDLPP
jgi:hypothetical protein